MFTEEKLRDGHIREVEKLKFSICITFALFANVRNMLLSQLVCRVQLLLYSVLLLIL